MIKLVETTDEDNVSDWETILLAHLNYDGRGSAVAIRDGAAGTFAIAAVDAILHRRGFELVEIDRPPVRDLDGRDESTIPVEG